MILISCLIAFAISSSDTSRKQVMVETGNCIICFMEEDPPLFPGGEKALTRYLEKNIKYPSAALKAKISGTVFVQFTVAKTGAICDVHTVGTYKGYSLEEEAIRVVSKMPKWKPAKMGGQYTDVMFNLPIRFIFPPEKENKKRQPS